MSTNTVYEDRATVPLLTVITYKTLIYNVTLEKEEDVGTEIDLPILLL
jgi:hypothetical protein